MTQPLQGTDRNAAQATPRLALLLDVDGPIASPVTRNVKPEIIADLVALASAGIPVVFNTGRSDAFISEQVMEPMIAAGMPEHTVIHAICEKGAVWFSYTSEGPGPIHVDSELAVPKAYGDDIRRLVAEDSTFFGDLFPHVVQYQGVMYLEDGLHRAVRTALHQRTAIHARVLVIDG